MGQLIANSIISGAVYAVMAAGFSLVYGVRRFFYIAFGGIAAAAALVFHSAHNAGWPLPVALLPSLLAAVGLSAANELFVHRPILRRGGGSLPLFLASSAVLILVSNVLLLAYGPSARTFHWPVRRIHIGSAIVTPTQVLTIGFAVGLYVLLLLFLKLAPTGREIRALRDSETLARACGLNTSRLSLMTMIVSGVLACAAGVLVATQQDARFDMGTPIVLKAIIASIIGGVGNVPSALAGGLTLGLVENVAATVLPPGYKDVVSSATLLIFLALRPAGILGAGMIERRGA